LALFVAVVHPGADGYPQLLTERVAGRKEAEEAIPVKAVPVFEEREVRIIEEGVVVAELLDPFRPGCQ
jgi:hypothetical protein